MNAEEIARPREDWIEEILLDLLDIYVGILIGDDEPLDRKRLCEKVVATSKKLAQKKNGPELPPDDEPEIELSDWLRGPLV